MKLANITKRIKASPKKLIVLVVALMAIAVPAMVMAGAGPARPTYDWNKYDATKSCTDPSQAYGRCGSTTGPVFNSFINTPSYGDERNFTRIAEVVAGQSAVNADFRETSTATAGKSYWVRTFVHNNANQNLNGANLDGVSVARGTKVRVDIAAGVVNGIDVASYVSATNSSPASVYDTATLNNSSQAFSVSYVPGSASIYNSAHKSGLPLSDAIVSNNGTAIGYQDMNGNLPGCFDYSAYVYVQVTVKAPAISLSKEVRMKGEDSSKWRNQLEAKDGDHVQYLLDYKNTGTAVDNNIVIRDKLPTNLQLVPGTVKWIDQNRPTGTPVPDSYLFAEAGLIIGNYGPNGGGYIMFEAVVKNDNKVCVAKNVGFVRADNVPEISDDAIVTIKDCNVTSPIVRCDLLDVSSLGSREFKFVVSYTAKNATFKRVTYNFGDKTAPFLTDKTTVTHKYAEDGNYTVTAAVTFMVNGVEKTVTSAACKTVVSSKTTVDHCPIPGKENLPKDSPDCKEVPFPTVVTGTSLPDTGADSVAAVFAATTVAGAMAYRVFMARRLGSE